MAKPTKAQVLAAATKAALVALYNANDLDCVEVVECIRCKTCTRCTRCNDCKNCTDCFDCREVTNGLNCSNCSNLKDATNCENCHGSDANGSQKLFGCHNCTFVERSFFVRDVVGTEAQPIRNRFMHLELTAAEFDSIWALPES